MALQVGPQPPWVLATPHCPCHPQYRLAPIPRARHYFACASLVFICILLVHILLMPRSVREGRVVKPTGVRLRGASYSEFSNLRPRSPRNWTWPCRPHT